MRPWKVTSRYIPRSSDQGFTQILEPSNIIHSSQTVEAIQMSINSWNDKQNKQILLLYLTPLKKQNPVPSGQDGPFCLTVRCSIQCILMTLKDTFQYTSVHSNHLTSHNVIDNPSVLPGSFILPNVCLVLCFLVLKHVSQKSKSSQFLHLNLDPLIGNIWQPSHLFLKESLSWFKKRQDLLNLKKTLLPKTNVTVIKIKTHVTPGCILGTNSISDNNPVQWDCWGKSTMMSFPLALKAMTEQNPPEAS